MPSVEDIRRWAGECGRPDEIGELLELRDQARAVHREWKHRLREGHAALQTDYDELLRDATRIRNAEILIIPGLLQTPDYARARALEAVRMQDTDLDSVDATVTARMHREEVLYGPGKFEFIICDAALRYLLCPAPAMLGQLDRLLTISQLGNVTLGIIPPGVELPIAPMVGFLQADDVTIVETHTSEDTVSAEESAKYSEYWDGLLAEAVTGDDARALITAAIEALR